MKDNTNKQFWQKFAKIYAPFMKSSAALYNEICGEITQKLNKNMTVLELACGSGQLSFTLSDCVKAYEATDFSQAMINEAKKKKKVSWLHFSVQDATNLPYAENSFDAVIISNALHIMPYPEKALSEIKRVLKDDGILFAPTFIHGESKGYRLRIRLMEAFGFHTYSKWSEESFAQFLKNNGFMTLKHMVIGDSLAPLCYMECCQIKEKI